MEFPLREKIAGEIALSDQPGKTMRKWREELRISQTTLATHMRVSPSVISDYEAGRRTSPGIKTIHRLVDALLEIDQRTGQKLSKRFQEYSDVIPSMRDWAVGVRAADFLRKIDGKLLTQKLNTRRIVNYGGYIPRYRIRPKDIGVVWGADGEAMGRGLNIRAKSVPGPDEDVITISVEAARACMAKVDIDPTEIGAIYVGSESHPYAVKPTATIVAEAIGSAPVLTAADFEFACKAGTAAIQTTMGLTLSKMMKYGLAIGSDTSQGAPGDALEYSASAGGAALLIGVDRVAAEIAHTVSYTTDTPDFWRREGQRYPSHGGRFTGEPAYFKHVSACAQLLFKRAGTTAEDYDYAVFHQPNGKFPVRAAKQLGFKEAQIDTGLCVREIGNTYSGAIMVGLCAILDEAEAGDRIFAVGYGSGAGSDGFDLTVTEEITKLRRDATPTIKELIADQEFLDYATYAKYRGKILMREA